MKNAILFATAACSVAFFSAPVFAQEARSVHVVYRDLNLANPQGVATLERRVEKAVDDVCGSAERNDPAWAGMIEPCRQNARSMIAPQIQRRIAAAKAGEVNLSSR